MAEWLFWLVLLAVCLFLWWLSYYATKRMRTHRLGKQAERSPAAPSETATKIEEH